MTLRPKLALGLFLAGSVLYITFMAWIGSTERSPAWDAGYLVGYFIGVLFGAGAALSSMAEALHSSEERGFKKGLQVMQRLTPAERHPLFSQETPVRSDPSNWK